MWGFVGLAAFMVVSFVGVYWTFDMLRDYKTGRQGELVTSVPTGDNLPAEPLLQADPVKDMVVIRNAQNEKLHSYGWIDKDNGIVHIPIDKAIELTLERSLVHSQAAGEPIQSNPEN